jgi:hypothetical protein
MHHEPPTGAGLAQGGRFNHCTIISTKHIFFFSLRLNRKIIRKNSGLRTKELLRSTAGQITGFAKMTDKSVRRGGALPGTAGTYPRWDSGGISPIFA